MIGIKCASFNGISCDRNMINFNDQLFLIMISDTRYIIIIVIILIIKTSSTGPRGKNKIVYKLRTQPHKHLHHRKLKTKPAAETSGPQHKHAQIDPNDLHCVLYTRHDKQSA